MKIFHRDKIEIFGPGPLLALSESWGQPRRANWHPKHFHTVCLGGTHPYHALGPLTGPLLHSRGPKRARFGPKTPFLGSWKSSEGPQGPDLVPTAANWSDWVGVMVTTHFGLVLGLFWVPRDTKMACFGPKCLFLAPKGPEFQIVANLSCDLSKVAREGHSANENKTITDG